MKTNNFSKKSSSSESRPLDDPDPLSAPHKHIGAIDTGTLKPESFASYEQRLLYKSLRVRGAIQAYNGANPVKPVDPTIEAKFRASLRDEFSRPLAKVALAPVISLDAARAARQEHEQQSEAEFIEQPEVMDGSQGA